MEPSSSADRQNQRAWLLLVLVGAILLGAGWIEWLT